jgi:chromosome segregation ATPase
MADLSSEQDELYYFAKNFSKLKFSNQAYIDSTQKQKVQNEKEIEKLKKDYEKLRNDVNVLKKTCLYVPGRVKSAASSENNFYRLKLDEARNNKKKSQETFNQLNKKLEELKSEAKFINDDNNPYVKRIKLLENKLDKAMIKYNEAMSIRRTYEQILTRLKEERAGYDNQIAAIQKSLKAKGHDLNEFKLLLQDSKMAKVYSKLLVDNTNLSKKAFEDHFTQLIQAHRNENLKELQKEKSEERKKKNIQNEVQATISDDKPRDGKDFSGIEAKVKELEEKDKIVRETTGADDINEICQKFSNLTETKENLKNEQKELEKMLKSLKEKKEEMIKELKELKFTSQNEITRKQIEENEKKAEKCMNLCEESRQKLRKQNKLFVDISTGIDTLLLILSHKNFEEAIKNKIINDKDANDESDFEKKYTELIQSSKKNNDKDIIERLKQLNEVLKVIEGGCSDIRNHYRFDDEIQKLDRKEENEIENIYINAQEEQDEDDEYEQEDDMVPEMSTKDGRKNEYDSGMRPYSSVPSKPKRISISAKDKNY